MTEQVAKCLEAGMDGHLAKPFTPNGLLSAVANAVRVGRTQGRIFPYDEASRQMAEIAGFVTCH
jgi:DNA-binding response OmpR family regulator